MTVVRHPSSATVGATTSRLAAYRRALEVGALALLAYVPFLLSSPGKVSADTKQYLYLDPGRLLARAPNLWDAHVGAGTVPHQMIGYLFPMGPYYWTMDRIGVPDWVAQRLWLGTISLVAALGARWLFTMLGTPWIGALAGAVVYMLTPYQLAFTARISVLLLPWAALPWLVGLTIRATRRGGWRDPALFALVTLVIGGVNATSLLFVLLGPALWLLLVMVDGRVALRAALAAAARIGVLTFGVSLWWAAGLRLQGRYGLPVLELTEDLRTISEWSSPDDLLRGLGNWFFYGGDRLGFSLDQAHAFAFNDLVRTASFAVPVVALAAAGALRWRHRAYFALLVVVGTIVGVGAWPYDRPSVFGRIFRAFANDTSLGLAMRNTPRVVPLVALGLAGLLAAAVASFASRHVRLGAAVVVATLALAAFAPVWRHGYLSERLERPEEIPAYWDDAAGELDREGDATRVLAIPGANFAAYRWGNTVEPVTPGLIDRPFVDREILPFGTPASVNLLTAFDHRLQEGTFEPSSLAPVSRLLSVGTVLLRSDLEYERFDTPRPRLLWAEIADAPGLGSPVEFGPAEPNRASALLPMLDELELRTPPQAPHPPPVALFPVRESVPIVHAAPGAEPVVLAGDGDGIVDAAAAGLLDGDQLVLELAALDDDELRQALESDAALILTDTNRRRAQTWFKAIRDTTGATERAGQDALVEDLNDYRLPVFPDAGDEARTVVEQEGGRVDATGYGERHRYTPEDRPVHAVDGDLRTSWRVAGSDTLDGDRLILEPEQPVTTDRVTLVQPQTGGRERWVTRVRLSFDDGDPVIVELGPESRSPGGQEVRFDRRTVRRIEIEPLETNDSVVADPVGFSEVRLGDLRVTETVRLPVDVARRIGESARDHSLDIVLSRLRSEPGDAERQDEELSLVRRFEVPDTRAFAFSGTARVDPNAPDDRIDAVLGTTAAGATFTASAHLAGDAEARASRAFDGDATTVWSTPVGPQEGQWVEVSLPAPQTVDHIDLTVVTDGRHSVPTRLRIEADGMPMRTLAMPPLGDTAGDGSTQTVSIPFEPVTAGTVRLVVEAVRPVGTIDDRTRETVRLPVAIAEAALAGVPTPALPGGVPDQCRDDLLRVDGSAIPVRIRGPVTAARGGLAVESCGGPLGLDEGSHTLSTQPGLETGVDVDRVVLSSDETGAPAEVAPRGAPLRESGAQVRVEGEGPTSYDLSVRTDGEPFWLVLGQSHSDGWAAETGDGESLGGPRLVNGYANAWLVDPEHPGTLSIDLRWEPQRSVWAGLVASVVAALACISVVIATRRRRGAGMELADAPTLAWPFDFGVPATSIPVALGLAFALGAAGALVSRLWIGLVVAATVAIACRVRGGRFLLVGGSVAALVLAELADEPELGWVAALLLGADVACSLVLARSRAIPERAGP